MILANEELPSPTMTVALEEAASTNELVVFDAGDLEVDLMCRMAFSTILNIDMK